jgi:hypothetical protein
MEATTTLVSLKELERILLSIQHHQPHIFIRYRTLGEVWYPNFLKILEIRETGIKLYDNIRQSTIRLTDFTRIAELELNGKFESYQANYQYEVSDDHDD